MDTRIREVLNEIFRKLPIAEGERFESSDRLARSLQLMNDAGGYSGKIVLDLGAGNGAHACAAKKLGAIRVVAVDKHVYPDSDANSFRISEEVFSKLRFEWSAYGVEAMEGDLDQFWGFDDASFDTVVSNAVFEHLHGTHKHFLSEAFRVLKPGGTLLICTPNLAYLPKRLRFLLGRSPNWDLKNFFESSTSFTGYTREFTVGEVKMMAEWMDFQILSCRSYVTYFRLTWLKQWKKIHRLPLAMFAMFGRNLGDHVYLVARKPNV